MGYVRSGAKPISHVYLGSEKGSHLSKSFLNSAGHLLACPEALSPGPSVITNLHYDGSTIADYFPPRL